MLANTAIVLSKAKSFDTNFGKPRKPVF